MYMVVVFARTRYPINMFLAFYAVMSAILYWVNCSMSYSLANFSLRLVNEDWHMTSGHYVDWKVRATSRATAATRRNGPKFFPKRNRQSNGGPRKAKHFEWGNRMKVSFKNIQDMWEFVWLCSQQMPAMLTALRWLLIEHDEYTQCITPRFHFARSGSWTAPNVSGWDAFPTECLRMKRTHHV